MFSNCLFKSGGRAKNVSIPNNTVHIRFVNFQEQSLEFTTIAIHQCSAFIILRLYRIVMTGTNIRKPHWLHFPFIFFMKSSNRFISKNIDFYRSCIDFWQSLDFNIITPLPILSLLFNVFINVLYHIVPKKVFFKRNIIHANFSDLLMILLISIKLIWYWSKQTIPIACTFFYEQIFGI